MRYQSYEPGPALKPFVERFYLLERDGAGERGAELSVPACYAAALVFSYAEPIAKRLPDGGREVLPRSFVAGPSTRGSIICLDGRIGLVGVSLKSAGYLRFLGISAADVLNRRVDLDLVAGPDGAELGERLETAATHRARIDAVETFLLRRLALHRSGTPDWADHFADLVLARRGSVSITSLASQFAISCRQLRRQFRERAGLGPKMFARLKRFGYASLLLSPSRRLDVQDVVFMAGFYDQAHLIKELRSFGGDTPAAARQASLPTEEAARMSVFYNTVAGADR